MYKSEPTLPGMASMVNEQGKNETGKYVYGIIELEAGDAPREFGQIGIGGGPRVYTVHYRGLAAVVSDSPCVIYEATPENVLSHENVNAVVLREFTLIPISFGLIFRSEADVVELRRSTYQELRDVMRELAGQLEFGLKV